MSDVVADGDRAAGSGAPWWWRLHRALMPDYNRPATLYWIVMVVVGCATLAGALASLRALPAAALAQVAAGTLVAMLAALFPLRIPRSKSSFAAGEIFIFLLLLMHGPAAAGVAAAGEALVGSWRTSRRWTSRIVSPALAATAMCAVGGLLHAALAAAATWGLSGAVVLLPMTMAGALLYFVVNTLLVTAVPYLKLRQWPRWASLFGNFLWIGISFAGSALAAALLYVAFNQAGLGVLLAAVPMIGLLLATLHYFFRQQEADEAARRSRLEAAEREAALAAQHVRLLEASERRFHSAFTHASIGMALVSVHGELLQANAALRALLLLPDGPAPAPRRFVDCVVAEGAAALAEQIGRVAAREVRAFALETRLRRADGEEVLATLDGSFFAEADEGAPCLILQVQDVTARRRAEAELQYIAFHDALTGLPNRRRLHELLEHALARSQRRPGQPFSVMFLDFDRFKLINDSLGHAVGDRFLLQVARRIQQNIRPADVVARLGGDEFAILAEDLGQERYAITLAERLLEVLRQPIEIEGHEIVTSASIGITFSGLGYTQADAMLRDADTAMYRAKQAGKARFALFDTALHAEVSQRLRLEGELRRALDEGRLCAAYQPIVHLSDGALLGFEALVRWHHPRLGELSPSVFLPVAEEAGLMPQLTDFMLRTACRQLARWQQFDDARWAGLRMQVNLSGPDVSHPGLVARVLDALQAAQVPPSSLALELTETILIDRLEAALPALDELRSHGVQLSVDDFGAGCSSLRHLSRLPICSLKIDRSFVADLGCDDGAVIEAVALLGARLGKTIVAEGIETEAQRVRLHELGCTQGQGFLLGKPMGPTQVEQLLINPGVRALRDGRWPPEPAPATPRRSRPRSTPSSERQPSPAPAALGCQEPGAGMSIQ